jgi:hypothetical protein
MFGFCAERREERVIAALSESLRCRIR